MSQRPSDLGQKHCVAVKRGLFKTEAKKAEAEKEESPLDKYFDGATPEYEEKALEEPHTPQWKLRQRKQPDWWCYAR